MKPLVSVGYAWCCVVLSAFAIVILSVVGALFSSNHESVMGSTSDPEDGKKVAGTVYGAVAVYVFFLFCCAGQAWLHKRSRGVVLE